MFLTDKRVRGAERKGKQPDQVSSVWVRQQQQQQSQADSQQLPGRASQSSAEHGPLSEEPQLVGRLRDQRSKICLWKWKTEQRPHSIIVFPLK